MNESRVAAETTNLQKVRVDLYHRLLNHLLRPRKGPVIRLFLLGKVTTVKQFVGFHSMKLCKVNFIALFLEKKDITENKFS